MRAPGRLWQAERPSWPDEDHHPPRPENQNRMRPSTILALGASLTVLTAAHRGTAAENGLDATKDTESSWTADFSLLEEYRLRIASGALPDAGRLGNPPPANQQVDQHLRLLGDGQVSGANDHFRALASGALWLDLDGAAAPGTASIFATQYDNAQPFVAAYALSAEWQKQGVLDHVRVGRQASEHGLPLTFDGVSLGVRVLDRRLLLFGFGGRTVHFFETKPGFFENWVASTGAVLRPNAWSLFEVDARIIQEQVLDADRSQRDRITNHSYGLSASLRSESLYSKLFARGIDNRVSHVGGGFQFHDQDLRLGLDARIVGQLVTLGEVVESENPFFSLLGPSLPYARWRFESWKDFAVGRQSNLSFYLGWRGRQLVGNSEQPFNRNTGALYFHTRVDDFITKGLFVGGTAEANYVPRALAREWLLAFGGSAGYTSRSVKTEVGTYFQQFKINYYRQAEEMHNARTVYGAVTYRLLTWLELRARYEIDVFDRYLQSFFLSARQDF
jgi:hypothetical protein